MPDVPAQLPPVSPAWTERVPWADSLSAFPHGMPSVVFWVISFYALLFLAGMLADALLIARSSRFSRETQDQRTRWLAARPIDAIWLAKLALLLMLLHVAAAWVGSLLIPYWVAGAILAQSLLFHGTILILTLRHGLRAGTSLAVLFGLKKEWCATGLRLAQGIWGYLAVLPPMVGAAALSYLVLTLLGLPAAPQDITNVFDKLQGFGNQALLLLVAAGLAPLGEEILFRGLALPVLTRHFGLVRGVVISAAVFALLHFNAFAFLPLFTFGLALGGAYWMTGSLLVPVIMHAAFNAVNSTLLMVMPAGM